MVSSAAAALMMQLAENVYLFPDHRILNARFPKPGQYLDAVTNEATRRILQQLTSADLADVRWPPWR